MGTSNLPLRQGPYQGPPGQMSSKFAGQRPQQAGKGGMVHPQMQQAQQNLIAQHPAFAQAQHPLLAANAYQNPGQMQANHPNLAAALANRRGIMPVAPGTRG